VIEPEEGWVLFHNGTIRLGDERGTTAEALLAKDGRVFLAGEEQRLRSLVGAAAREVDLGGGFAVPGLQDAHGHVEALGALLEGVGHDPAAGAGAGPPPRSPRAGCGGVGSSRPATVRRRILRAQALLLSLGLTGVHDLGLSPTAAEVYAELARTGELRLRVAGYLDGDDGLPRGAKPVSEGPAGRFRVVGARLSADGELDGHDAALERDYADRPGHRGRLRASAEQLEERVRACLAAGLQPAVHAVGDRAARVALDAIERALADPVGRPAPVAGPRLEHAPLVAPPDRWRLQRLGVVPSVQPGRALAGEAWAAARLGAERLREADRWTRLAPDTDRLALGSDFPRGSPDPLAGLAGARRDGGLTAEEALHGATRGAAGAVGEGASRGRLVPGSFADLTVLDADPVAGSPAELLAARVRLTVVEGEVVYRSPAAARAEARGNPRPGGGLDGALPLSSGQEP